MDFIRWIRQEMGEPEYGKSTVVPVSQIQKYLNERYEWLCAKQRELEHREKLLKERECALTVREQELDKVRSAVKETLEGMNREREQLRQELAARTAAGFPAEELQEVKRQFMAISRELQQTRDKLVQLSDAAARSCDTGVELLCRLHRELSVTGEPRLLRYADQLGFILQSEFQAEPVQPYPGDDYDNTIHERLDVSKPGDTVLRCRVLGWSRNGEVLIRAVVETMEGSMLG